MKHARDRFGRYLVLAVVALAVIAQSLVAAIPAHAQGVQSPPYFDRRAVMQRARTWTDAGVPYSQTDWLKNYRTDCSGFVSMAWGLDQSFVTWSLPEVAKRISKEELQPGDILLQQNHVILFGGWADAKHTSYTVYEQVGGPIHRAVKRVIPYPYDSNPGAYEPYRYTGGHNLSAPGNTLPTALMETNAGGGDAAAPTDFAAKKNEQIRRVAAEHAAQLKAKARAEAKKHAEAQAAAKKAEAVKAAAAKARAEEARKPAPVRLFDGLLTFITQ